ncbi:MAG: PIN domain-containing protein [Vicinamibacteria bacterium]|jgi:predicted nucleic acid-binding protein|nr:PIN domain-containing protein [Vicinamibacteria bacterium]
MILVDSSVLIDFFRGRETPAVARLSALEADAEASPWALPLVCFQEVLQGARDEREWKRLREALETQELVGPADPEAVHVEAARIFFECRRRGLTVRSSTDCLIAALTLERGDALLHDDADFEAIARVRPLRTLRG